MPVHTRDPLNPRASHWNWLSYYIRWLREQNGLSLAQCGKILGVTRGTVCNFESGYRRLDEHYAKLLDERYDTGDLVQTMVFYACMTHDPNWAATVAAYEAEAWILKIYQGQVVPGPFQIEDTIRAQLSAARNVPELEAAVRRRLDRQQVILNRKDRPYVYLLLDEQVLEQLTGGPTVLKAQLVHLVEMSDEPKTSIRIVPRTVGAHVGQDGPIRYVGLSGRSVSYMGAQRGGRLDRIGRRGKGSRARLGPDQPSGPVRWRLPDHDRPEDGEPAVTTQWRKSSYSTAIQDEACVELARFPSVVGIRDSKNPEAGHLALSRRQFAGLTRRIKGSD